MIKIFSEASGGEGGEVLSIVSLDSAVDGGREKISRRRILIVDDNSEAAKIMGWTMEMYGHEIALAYDGPSALDIAMSYEPEFVFLDISLPGMNGYDVCEVMKTMKGLENVVFVAQTGWDQEKYRMKSEEVGFHYYFVKPIDIRLLQDVLMNHDPAFKKS